MFVILIVLHHDRHQNTFAIWCFKGKGKDESKGTLKHTIKDYRRVEIEIHAFLTSAVTGGMWLSVTTQTASEYVE
jgi:hypothetical protein